ncbi:MAG: hypothetical protein A2312_03000 [Candidatus Staskawiczbacteria bacterium RIFOXYB2_FULL_32_9]|uniref:Bro-N domain-containing protein n=1 Tax=Candidatus Staskawiczbacteria bacterium RIFOXYD1_FULL_32_13 TaxID=1802234 RepID=A0A1G2JM38_9BACT|nr:MAG: hypothetical protein A2256_03830 [Candidatus Staskawiczbacteria bacterium RIFOXYA2_FULL_32_7]OGZ78665.1 MAG: hypothetical protein A2360_00525 [Candidatus Staskawiczbacteria bacterium RIFOXYB1_FULL_32_11]OGZ81542.1 MAG: hypothetical protein A2312_03000 [Candidatus Staskawiczbacteria bacterium RIFOXYB2_FULL_32_9]OGZ86904.1 MAG: hypothetical protein A2463_02010 [Candidatus Staskawiczbacteria bacterium RIFOXYC2_FULL_32_10]OGZ88184.1 MAG: hypothetical protein A2561_05265 [Candidatus Staskawi
MVIKDKKDKIAIFQGNKIRRIWDDQKEIWYFSVIDIISALTDSVNPRDYWFRMKERVKTEEGAELSTFCRQLKLPASDGKYYLTDVSDTQGILRIIQSIPSPKAEPFKLWLARVGYERIEETEDPEKAIQRALRTYLKKGYSKEWVDLRLKTIEIRKDLTNEWQERGVKTNDEFAVLTDDISFAWAGLKTKDYKHHKDLKKENLRDNMTNLELVLNMLAETATIEISKKLEPKTFPENRKVAREGGGIAGTARKQIEAKTGKPVISKLNFKKVLEQKKLK